MFANCVLIGSGCLLQVGVTGAPRGKSKQTNFYTVNNHLRTCLINPGGKFGGKSGGQSGLLVRTGPVL